MTKKMLYWMSACLMICDCAYSYAQEIDIPVDPPGQLEADKNPTANNMFLSMPGGQEWQFHKFGNTPVNHYTGTASVSIPIYMYKDKDFELPLSLTYASGGYMPYVPTGTLGLGWSLTGIGDISRTINGIEDDFNMDEFKGYDCGDYLENVYLRRYGVLELLENPEGVKDVDLKMFRAPGDDGRIRFFFSGSGPWMYYPDPFYEGGTVVPDRNECKPDTYIFKFFNHAGRFQFAPMLGMKYKIYNTNHPWGEYKLEYDYGLSDEVDSRYTIRSFSITTGDGYKYIFGGTSDEIRNHSVDDLNGTSLLNYDCFSRAKKSWPLTTVIASNGRRIEYEYEGGAKSEDGRYKDFYSTYQIISDYENVFVEKSDNKDGTYGYSYATELNRLGKEEKVIHTAYSRIKRIFIDTKIRITFYYKSRSKELCRHPQEPELENRGLIERIAVDRMDESGQYVRLRTCLLTYKEAARNPVPMLKSVTVSGEGTYRMEYYLENDVFPIQTDLMTDAWGFYKGSPHLGMLKKITYPTQGCTEFEYESHRFSYSLAKHLKHRENTILLPVENKDGIGQVAGGLRIKRIIDYDENGNVATDRKFDYTHDGKSTGISLGQVRYFDYTANLDEKDRKLQSRHSALDALRQTYTMEHTHIEYSSVTEIQNDGSKKIRYFSNYRTIPDINRFDKYDKLDNGEANDKIPLSMQSQRGRLIRTEYYDADDKLCYKEINEYDTTRTLRVNPSVEYSYVTYYFNGTVVDDYPLAVSRKIYYDGTDSIVLEKRYRYNDLGQICRTETSDGAGNTIVTKIQYVTDAATKTDDNLPTILVHENMLSYPYKRQESIITADGSEKLLSGVRYNYDELFMSPYSYPIKNISATALPGNIPWDDTKDFAFEQYLVTGTTYDYDRFGNIVQETDRNGFPTAYVWGHDGHFLVAKVVGSTFERLQEIQGLGDIYQSVPGNLTEEQISALYALKDTQVSIFDHDPYVGVTRTIDPSGRKAFYRYDADGKLIFISDENHAVVQSYDYHIKTE